MLNVSDTGIGIDPSFWQFSAFRQADASASRKHGGLVLGMTIVRSSSSSRRYRVGRRKASKGRDLRVRLPSEIAAQHAEPGLPPGRARSPDIQLSDLSPNRGLVVDMTKDTRHLLQTSLESSGARRDRQLGGRRDSSLDRRCPTES